MNDDIQRAIYHADRALPHHIAFAVKDRLLSVNLGLLEEKWGLLLAAEVHGLPVQHWSKEADELIEVYEGA